MVARTLAGMACAALATVSQDASADCADPGAARVAITSALGVGAGAAGALAAAGIIAGVDDTRDFKFGIGAGVGIGVTAGITAIYTLVDVASDCAMVTESDGVVWTIPIITAIVGTLLPIAVWGAADPVEDSTETAPAALDARRPLVLGWRF